MQLKYYNQRLAGSEMTTSRYILISLAILILSSCKTPTSSLTGTPSDLSLATKFAAISGQNYTLATTLWRDFQPISPPDGKPLILVVDIIESNSKTIPSSIKVDSFWVINGDQIWSGILIGSESWSGFYTKVMHY